MDTKRFTYITQDELRRAALLAVKLNPGITYAQLVEKLAPQCIEEGVIYEALKSLFTCSSQEGQIDYGAEGNLYITNLRPQPK